MLGVATLLDGELERQDRRVLFSKNLEGVLVGGPYTHHPVEAEVGLSADVNEVRQNGIRFRLSALLALDHRRHAWYQSLEVARVDTRQDEDLVSAPVLFGQAAEPDVLVVADRRVGRPGMTGTVSMEVDDYAR